MAANTRNTYAWTVSAVALTAEPGHRGADREPGVRGERRGDRRGHHTPDEDHEPDHHRPPVPRPAQRHRRDTRDRDHPDSVLALVHVRGPLGLHELTVLEGINPTMLSRVVKVLDERGLIRRTQNPGDLRAARVEATPEGARLHDEVRARRTRVLSDCLDGLPEDTVATLLKAVPDLEALAEALKPPSKSAKG